MGVEGLKPLSYAFKQIKVEDLNYYLQEYPQESEEFRNALEAGMIYLGTFGLDDPIS